MMTLQRQLLITIFVLFTGMFIGTMLISGYLGRTYFERQLSTHARDTATSLGLLLSTHMEKNDVVMATSIIDTVFDRGYYESIQLYNRSGKLLVKRFSRLRINQVPSWFVNFVAFHSSIERATISSGWKQSGTIMVSSHPGYAYQEFWMSTVAIFAWFLTLAILMFGIGVLIINYLFRPIKLISAHAQSISSGVLPDRLPLPKPAQLRQVTIAMNLMTESLRRNFKSQQEEAINLRNQLYQDDLTGVYNRLYFSNYILHQVTLSESRIQTTLLAVKIIGLEKFNKTNMFLAEDEFLHHVASKLIDIVSSRPHSMVCRLNESCFIIILNSSAPDFINSLTMRINRELEQLILHEADINTLSMCFSVLPLERGMTENEILQKTNKALFKRAVDADSTQGVSQLSEASALTPAEMLNKILETNLPCLFQQAVYEKTGDSIAHYSLNFRAADALGQLHSELYVRSLITQKQENGRLEKFFFDPICKLLKNSKSNYRYAVTLSTSEFSHSDFKHWLDSLHYELGPILKRLIFEVPEKLAVNNIELFQTLNHFVIQHDSAMAISYFGVAFSSFAYLLDIPLDYIKLDPSLTQRLQYSEDKHRYVQSLVRVAKTLGIRVMAEGIENKANFDLLQSFGVDLFQGHFLHPIERIEDV